MSSPRRRGPRALKKRAYGRASRLCHRYQPAKRGRVGVR